MIIWSDCMRNVKALHRFKEDRNVLRKIKKRNFK